MRTKKETNWVFFFRLTCLWLCFVVFIGFGEEGGMFHIHEDKEKCILMHHKTKESVGYVEVSMHVHIG